VVSDEKGRLWMAYHAWDESAVGYASGGMRELWIDPLVFDGGRALVKGPTDGPEPAP
jgi:hypothetical protein